MSPNERTPLLGGNPLPFLNSDFIGNGSNNKQDIHQQFCLLVGVPPSNAPKDAPKRSDFKRTLYGRAINKRNAQNGIYLFTAALSNTLLLTQVVLGAALTALGASESSHILITVFGALNTIIAGLVAYLKSRGQPMRARMFRDDLDRVVDEMENSEVMWLGIQQGVHGYDEIAIDDSVSVRSEVARLTRLLDKAVRSNTINDPDMYMNAVGEGSNATLRARPTQPQIASTPESSSASNGNASAPAKSTTPVHVADPDASPATAPPKHKNQAPSSSSESTEETAKPTPESGLESGLESVPKSTPVPEPALTLSPVVAVEDPSKGATDANSASGATDIGGATSENDTRGNQASEGHKMNDEGNSSSSSEDGDGGLVKKGEQNLDGA